MTLLGPFFAKCCCLSMTGHRFGLPFFHHALRDHLCPTTGRSAAVGDHLHRSAESRTGWDREVSHDSQSSLPVPVPASHSPVFGVRVAHLFRLFLCSSPILFLVSLFLSLLHSLDLALSLATNISLFLLFPPSFLPFSLFLFFSPLLLPLIVALFVRRYFCMFSPFFSLLVLPTYLPNVPSLSFLSLSPLLFLFPLYLSLFPSRLVLSFLLYTFSPTCQDSFSFCCAAGWSIFGYAIAATAMQHRGGSWTGLGFPPST